MSRSYVFGPVPSRRLGRSLGVDLVPFKTCSYDCVYCQLGRTTCKTVERREWAPLEEALDQLRQKLPTKPDYVTLSGSGEPALHSRTGEAIRSIKNMTDVPVAVLTNGSLLGDPQVREELLPADLVIPSLDAGDEQIFRHVNRPHADLSFEEMVDGLVEFGRAFGGDYWLEVLLLGGITTVTSQAERLAEIVERIDPDRVQLNTVTRPPAERYALPVPREQMERLAKLFGSRAEVIADFSGTSGQDDFAARRSDVLDLLSRRPCTIGDIANGLSLHQNEVIKYIEELYTKGTIVIDEGARPDPYYRVANSAP